MKDKKITYIFGFGRKNKLNNPDYSDEFFYGFSQFATEGYDTQLIEFTNIESKFYIYTDRILRNILKLPFYFSNIVTKQNRMIIGDSDYIIFSNERTFLASYFMLKKAKNKKKIKSAVFIMGLFSKLSNNLMLLKIQKLILNKMLNELDALIFLGIGELKHASELFPSMSDKFFYMPFELNKEFWQINHLPNLKSRKNILFIGNDGNREYQKVVKIAERLKDFNFIFITQNINERDINSDNIKLIGGHWNKSDLTDRDIIEYYDSSYICIIPIKNSLQPSGQSVALQSMSRGVPVMITKTDGFWDKENYKNEKNIIFVDEDSVDGWVDKLIYFSDNLDKLSSISEESIKTFSYLNDKYSFFKNLKKILKV